MLRVPTKQALKALFRRGVTFNSDGLISFHGADFLSDPGFARAYRAGIARYGEDAHVEWRVRVALWAATQGMRLEGDFIECGVNTGILTGAILEHVCWNAQTAKRFYLLDTFKGIPTADLGAESAAAARAHNENYGDVLETVRRHFARYTNVILVPGAIPHTLPQVPATKVAYLSIDMNVPEPELAAGEFFWPKMQPGAVIVLDDYNFFGHERQRRAWDEFARRHRIDILPLPTGQGLIVKPPG
jgi:hypothetical protein